MLDFTKVKWAAMDCILITNSGSREPILILNKQDIDNLILEWSTGGGR